MSKVVNADLTNREARLVAKEIAGEEVKWDWDLPRTKEGYYHYQGGVAVCCLFPFERVEQELTCLGVRFRRPP